MGADNPTILDLIAEARLYLALLLASRAREGIALMYNGYTCHT